MDVTEANFDAGVGAEFCFNMVSNFPIRQSIRRFRGICIGKHVAGFDQF
jgi:hypothetical protein